MKRTYLDPDSEIFANLDPDLSLLTYLQYQFGKSVFFKNSFFNLQKNGHEESSECLSDLFTLILILWIRIPKGAEYGSGSTRLAKAKGRVYFTLIKPAVTRSVVKMCQLSSNFGTT